MSNVYIKNLPPKNKNLLSALRVIIKDGIKPSNIKNYEVNSNKITEDQEKVNKVDLTTNIYSHQENTNTHDVTNYIVDSNLKKRKIQEVHEKKSNKKTRNQKICNQDSISISEKCKFAIIKEFERLKKFQVNAKYINNEDNTIEINEEEIKKAYNGTELNKDNDKRWENLILFLKLTKEMNYKNIAKIVKAKNDSFRKKLIGYKRAYNFLINFKPENYCNIKLPLSAFQKINESDWKNVLEQINRV